MSDPVTWAPKDADEVKQYELNWAPPNGLLAGDTVVTSVWTDAAGLVVEASAIDPAGLKVYALISGGTNGETGSVLNTITSANGETLEQVVLLPMVASEGAPLGEYETPGPQDLIARYPAFVAVPYNTLAVHIADAAASGVDTSWAVGDYAPAILALAAHNMALLGIGEHGETAGYARQGVTGLRDGAFSVQFSDKAADRASGGAFNATPFGRVYAVYLRRNRGGPRLVGGGVRPDGWGALGIQNNGGIVPWAY